MDKEPRPTVEESRRVDAETWLCSGEVPQLAQWLTLTQGHTDANGCERQLEDDGAIAQITKDLGNRCENRSIMQCWFGNGFGVPNLRYMHRMDVLMKPTMM